MARGRHYYDPELQTDRLVEGEKDLSRIELFPVGQDSTARLPDEHGNGVARKIEADGSISGFTPGDFNHDAAVRQAEEKWPGVQVYELRSEIEDSTWEGHGPSPRIWQNAVASPETKSEFLNERMQSMGAAYLPPISPADAEAIMDAAGLQEIPPEVADEVQLRVLPINELGAYVLISDIRALLEMWAVQYEVDKNPSAAMALRDAVDALKDVG